MFLEENQLADLRTSKKSKKNNDSRSALKAEIMTEIEAKCTAGGSRWELKNLAYRRKHLANFDSGCSHKLLSVCDAAWRSITAVS